MECIIHSHPASFSKNVFTVNVNFNDYGEYGLDLMDVSDLIIIINDLFLIFLYSNLTVFKGSF